MIRPPFISVIGWLLVASGVLGLLSLAFHLLLDQLYTLMEQSGLPPRLMIGFMTVSTFIYLVSGWAVLAGRNWGRHLLAIAMSAMLLIGLYLSPSIIALILSVLFLGLMIGPLYRPIASRYFLGRQTEADIQALSSPDESAAIGLFRKVSGIVLFVVSGLTVYMLTLMSFVAPDGGDDTLVKILLWAGVIWLICHGMALWVYATPSRLFASGLTMLIGAGFTLLIILMIYFYPMPPDYADMDVKQSLGNLSTGIPLLTAFLLAGGIQLAVGIRGRSRKPLTQPH